jgi:hypothetical protein
MVSIYVFKAKRRVRAINDFTLHKGVILPNLICTQ